MWVYKGESLTHRMQLDRRTGFWLDYWLFLHFDETHPIWCSRPLSLRGIAEAAIATQAKHDKTLRRQLKHELAAAIPLLDIIHAIPKLSPDSFSVTGNDWEPDVLRWCSEVLSMPYEGIITSMVNKSLAALATDDYPLTAYLMRRLSSELSRNVE